jgi:hypothetical protein
MAAIDRVEGHGPYFFGRSVEGAPEDGCIVADTPYPILGYELDHAWLCFCTGKLASIEGHLVESEQLLAQAVALKDIVDYSAPWGHTFTGNRNVAILQVESGVIAVWRRGVCEHEPPPRQWPPTRLEYFGEEP